MKTSKRFSLIFKQPSCNNNFFWFRNKYEVPNLQMDSPVGLYNIPQQRTSQAFSSMDDLDALVVAQKQLSGNFCSKLILEHVVVV